MSGQLLTTQALALARVPTGDNWLRVTAFSADHGILDCLQRIARRSASRSPPIDLFDEVQVSLESRNQGRTWFVGEVTVIGRHAGLSASYAALRDACRFAQVLARNPVPDESRAAVYALLKRALEAWAAGSRPEVIYLKSLFLLARDEGYPVREEWWRRLPPDDREAADAVLRRPAADQAVGAPDVSRLGRSLEEYLAHHAEFRFEGS
jgi:recombinational DNA repair protein (RecF pathway)